MKVLSGIFILSIAISVPQLLGAQSCKDFQANSDITSVLPRCNGGDGEIVFEFTSGGVPPYQYELDGFKTSTGAFFDLDTGLYKVIVTDARGCNDTTLVALQYESLGETIQPFNAFSPNNDGINDTWVIPGIESYQGAEVRVFNRWGQQVHVNTSYDNEFGWDGTNNGAKLASATYYYVISVYNQCAEESIAGTVSIVK
ncbi:MAG: gliding motility-associated C-terminal domain-containing protein [Vicingaceae bacterium]